MSGCYELKLAKNGEFFFNLLAANGQGILKSEMYTSKSAALNGIASVQTNCSEDSQYECKTSNNGKDYFVLKAKNHQVIGQSQMYESDAGCKNGIESVKSNGVSTEIKDLTES
ncbi:MAG: YegP family protein [Pseudomonadota bacterium]